jgi:hypothetical protein
VAWREVLGGTAPPPGDIGPAPKRLTCDPTVASARLPQDITPPAGAFRNLLGLKDLLGPKDVLGLKDLLVGVEKAPLQSIDFIRYSGCLTCGIDLCLPFGV